MRTAKEIIEEYRARGYGMESLRVLADSRDEPLRSEMLSRLAAEESPSGAADEAMAFFIVSEDEEVEAVGADVIDFDILASDIGVVADAEVDGGLAGIGSAEGETLLEDGRSGPDISPENAAELAEEAIAAREAWDDAGEQECVANDDGMTGDEGADGVANALGVDISARDEVDAVQSDAQDAANGAMEHVSDYLPVSTPASLDVSGIADQAKPAVSDAFPAPPQGEIENPGEVGQPAAERKEAAAERKRRRRAERKRAKEERKRLAQSAPAVRARDPYPREAALEETGFAAVLGPVEADGPDSRMSAAGDWDVDMNEACPRDLAADNTVIDDSPGHCESDADSGNVLHLFNTGNDDIRPESDDLLIFENSAEAAEPATGADKADAVAELSPMARLGLLRALAGNESAFNEQPEFADGLDGAEAERHEHVIVQPESETAGAPAPNGSALAEMEQDYQTRLDEFAKRLLELQASAAECEMRLRAKTGELEDRERRLAETTAKLSAGESAMRGMTGDLARMSDDLAGKTRDLERLNGLREEHERLYREFEDLRKAYNEVVSTAMPSLQNERDELVLTVEQQSEDEERLRSALRTSGRRMAVGYSLAAAAAVMMVALPVMHWFRASESDQELALNRQRVSELRERLDKSESLNVKADKTIFDLERQGRLERIERSKLEQENKDLAQRLNDRELHELALLRSSLSGGGSARTALAAGDDLGLSGSVDAGGRPHVNEVRDPGGSINQVLAANRERYTREDAAVMASAQRRRSSAGMQVSAIASARPTGAGKGQAASVAAKERTASNGRTAVVKTGEGVAQVVYRVLGTRDPGVIAWVIRENGIKKDKRGNPMIYPEQKLLLPGKTDRAVQSASAAR